MTSTRTVALVGRPNVGKSRLFNRLAGRRIAIVHDQPGVTRDVNAVEVAAASGTYSLLDTGGIGLEDAKTPRQIVEAAEEQVFVAVEASDLICFVVDAKDGLTTLDEIIATRLRKSGKKLILVINKVDNPEDTSPVGEFSRLGMGHGICVSAEHGNNEDALRSAIERNLPPAAVEEATASTERRTRICFIGRPNVGKSSLCNALLKSERLVVSEVPGTTRDSIELDLDYTQKDGTVLPFRLVDTAGLRRRANIANPVEYFSAVRSEQAIESADVALVVLDALDGVTRQEQALLGKSLAFAPGVAVIVNKWDHAVEAIREGRLHQYKSEREYREAFEKSIRELLFFLPDSPIVFVSALSGLGIDRILKMASGMRERMDSKLPTASINRLLEKLFERRQPKMKNGRRFKAYYALQTGNRPIKIRIFCNSIEKLDDNYRRYLEHGFIEEFDLRGCPLRFELIGKPPRERKD